MNFLRIVDWSRRQHFKDRRPPWIKAYVDRLDSRTRDGAAFSQLSRDAMLLFSLLEMLASQQDQPGLVPDEAGWIAYELRLLRLTSRQISKLISELKSVRLVESISVSESQSDIDFGVSVPLARPFARASGLSGLSVSSSSGEEGSGEEGDERPAQFRVAWPLLTAVEHYRLAAERAKWPGIRDSSLRRVEAKFMDVDAAIKSEEPGFDWLVCFGRGVEQPFIATISSFGFEWFLRREFSGTRFNALKVWDGAFRDRRGAPKRDKDCCAGCLEGTGCLRGRDLHYGL